MICLYIIHDVFRRWREAPHYTCFVKDRRLFPHALGTGADKKWNEHAKTRSFITSFSAKNFGILRGADCADILEAGAGKCPPLPDQPDHLPQSAACRKRPSRLDCDWRGLLATWSEPATAATLLCSLAFRGRPHRLTVTIFFDVSLARSSR